DIGHQGSIACSRNERDDSVDSTAGQHAEYNSPSVSKRIAILQSSYIPWKGYFDLIASVDEFVLYDDAQYTKRDWRNRNLIKSPQGLLWLTIPVVVKGRCEQRICDTVVSEPDWPDKHWRSVRAHYSR